MYILSHLTHLLKNLYTQQIIRILCNGVLSHEFHIWKGTLQDSILSPYLQNLYRELIMHAVLENMKCKESLGRRCIKELRYADTTFFTKSLEEMTEILRKVIKENTKLGLKLNPTKTNMMVIGQKVNKPLKISGEIIKQVQTFNYLGSYICTQGECCDEIAHHICIAKGAIKSLQ